MTPGQECNQCSAEFVFDQQNTVVYWFENAPWFSYAQSFCPKCGTLCITFMRDNYEGCMEYFIKHDFGFITEGDPPPQVVAGFESTYEVHELTEVAITKRHELEIQNLHVVLENCPDDLLLDLFTDPQPPKLRPENWT